MTYEEEKKAYMKGVADTLNAVKDKMTYYAEPSGYSVLLINRICEEAKKEVVRE